VRLRVRRDLLSHERRAETTDEEEIRAWAEEYARKNGWVLNPDKKILDTVIRGLVRNKKKFGEQYCPCRLRSGDKEKDRTIICPCIYHQDEIAKDGHCHCQLYYRKDGAETVTEENE
jgi:ferredoxin-thioredoxin reductase catalytic chain